ncbi:MAG: cob(I)yrinic acid a,c-diamide adenosyltransferase [Bacteroidia bacterium]|nr:cob(I)yrinic acid a,c-diamide adenosyltransferase [Bacteroidia bacterium]
MKIYTKTGDKGDTSLIGGVRVPKSHARIEAYGTVDELNSWIGLIRDQKEAMPFGNILGEIQDRLFTIGSSLASDPEKARMKLPDLGEEDVKLLEKQIDEMLSGLPEMKSFILPGGHTTVSYCHIARCVCRRAERLSVALAAAHPVENIIITYLNRLSDYLFVLARRISADTGSPEMPWKPRL